LLFRQGATPSDAKIAVVSIQTAVELFAKYRIVQELGFAQIIRKGNVPRGGNLLVSAKQGHFSTLGYDACLEKVAELEWLGDWQRELIGELQRMRNTLVHFAGELDVEDTRRAVSALLVQVLALFAAGRARDEPEMSDHRQFLSQGSFDALTSHPEYLVEAFDAASGDPDADAIFTCWLCERETLTLRPAGAYFCWTCGLGAESGVAGFGPCWQCGEKDKVCFDRLNDDDGAHYGRCLQCGSTAFIGNCRSCGELRSAPDVGLLRDCACAQEG
jgi:hypothetical protein